MRLAPGDVFRSALAPRPSCLLSHPQSLLPLQGWAGGVGVAAGSQEHFRPTKCHPLHDRKPPLGSGRIKTARQILLMLSPQVMLCEAAKKCGIWPYPGDIQVPCWRTKYLNISEMSSVLSLGWEVPPAASLHPLITFRCASERKDTTLQHQKEKKTLWSTNVVFRWLWALPTLGPFPRIPPAPKLIFTCQNHSYSTSTGPM